MSSFPGSYQPYPTQCEVTVKGAVDMHEVGRRKRNGLNNAVGAKRYPGAEMDHNFAVMPGEILIGRKGNVATSSYGGGMLEPCTSSASGLVVEGSLEKAMRNMYFVGVAKTPDLGPDRDFFGNQGNDDGFAAVRAGTFSIKNNNTSRLDIFAGDLVAWTLPPMGGMDEYTNGPYVDNGHNSVEQNMVSAPLDKPLYQTIPFNPNDFSSQMDAIMAEMEELAGEPIANYQPNGNKPLTTLQEECGAFLLALDGITRVISPGPIPNLINADNTFNKAVIESLKERMQAAKNSEDQVKKNFFHNMVRFATGTYHSAASRVIGTALTSAKPGQPMEILLGMGRTGY